MIPIQSNKEAFLRISGGMLVIGIVTVLAGVFAEPVAQSVAEESGGGTGMLLAARVAMGSVVLLGTICLLTLSFLIMRTGK